MTPIPCSLGKGPTVKGDVRSGGASLGAFFIERDGDRLGAGADAGREGPLPFLLDAERRGIQVLSGVRTPDVSRLAARSALA
jgi:hypothetical protein